MISSPTNIVLAAALSCLAAAACSPAHQAMEHPVGTVLLEGFDESGQQWKLDSNRYWKASMSDGRLEVSNSALGTGISPVWLEAAAPRDFEIAVQATIDKEGLDGGWGVEFGGKDRKFAYRVLLYASGRFCVDRLFDVYPEFIHCVPKQPEVISEARTNTLRVRVVGEKISVTVNNEEIITFLDDRYEAGQLSLAVAGAGTRVVFDDVAVVGLR